jgi:chain length determinant protein EpsF
MTVTQFLKILWIHRWAELATLAGTLVAAVLVGMFIPKQYTASAALYVDVRTPDPVAGVPAPGSTSASYVATQVDILTSSRVAQAAVETLGLDKREDFRSKWMKATQGRGAIELWIANALEKKLDVRPSRESSVINVGFKDKDPDFAADAANAFVKAYLAINLELKQAPARQYAAWFEDQTKVGRDRLEAAQRKLSAFQQREGLLPTDERLDVELTRLNELSTQSTLLQTQNTDSQSKRGARPDTIAEVMENPLVNSLKTDISRLQAKLQEMSVNLGPNHPQILRTQQEIASLRARLGEETRQVSRSIDTTFQVGKLRERDVLAALAAQKDKVLMLNKQRAEMNVLKRDVEAAQNAYDAVSQRASQSRLESLTTQTNVTSLSPATPPTEQSRSRAILYLMALVVGLMLALSIGLVLELLNRRIRSLEDLAFALDVPVLGSIGASKILVEESRWRNARRSGRLSLGFGGTK